MKFQNPSMHTAHKIWLASDFIQILFKGHKSRKRDKSDKKKNVSNIYFL